MSIVSSVLGDLGDAFSLPITRRGMFSQDDFFHGFQKNYDNAVQDVLSRWGNKASKADRFASYRRLRERDASEDSLAATISENEDNYMIVVDMSEYASGQITVETIQCSAVIEGCCGEKSFKKKFPLPNTTIIDRVTADLSDENILTVTAPKKGRAVAIGTDDGHSSHPKAALANTASIDAQIIPGENSTAVSAATQAIKSEALLSNERRPSQSRIIPLNIEGETSSQTQIASTEVSSDGRQEVSERIVPTSVETQEAYRNSSSYHNRMLPINRRGKFFQDPKFETVWKDFETAIDEMVERRGSKAGMEGNTGDKFQSYRNLRDVVQQDDNQAADVSKESNECKIVVDVKDFADGHLDIKAIEGVVIVSGRKGPYTFERRFSVAGLTQPDKVSAALSTDGILTITAPLS